MISFTHSYCSGITKPQFPKIFFFFKWQYYFYGESESIFFHINWFITNKCNYHCTYCHPFNYAGSSKLFDINVYKKFVSKILEQIGNTQLVISFTGGEPTAMPCFDEFVDFLLENNVKIGITSNGSKSIKWWTKYQKAFDWVSLSFHTETSNTRQFIDIVETS